MFEVLVSFYVAWTIIAMIGRFAILIDHEYWEAVSKAKTPSEKFSIAFPIVPVIGDVVILSIVFLRFTTWLMTDETKKVASGKDIAEKMRKESV